MYTHIQRLKAFHKISIPIPMPLTTKAPRGHVYGPPCPPFGGFECSQSPGESSPPWLQEYSKCRRKKFSKKNRTTLSHQPPVCF